MIYLLSSTKKTSVFFEGKILSVSAVIIEDLLEITIQLASFEEIQHDLELGYPFRKKLDSDRINIVINALISHDFLLKKKLFKGKELKFQIKNNIFFSNNKREVLISNVPDMILSANPSEIVLPWVIEKPNLEDLYPFQGLGVNWLLTEKNRLLADDMGLGKTIQTIFAVRRGFERRW